MGVTPEILDIPHFWANKSVTDTKLGKLIPLAALGIYRISRRVQRSVFWVPTWRRPLQSLTSQAGGVPSTTCYNRRFRSFYPARGRIRRFSLLFRGAVGSHFRPSTTSIAVDFARNGDFWIWECVDISESESDLVRGGCSHPPGHLVRLLSDQELYHQKKEKVSKQAWPCWPRQRAVRYHRYQWEWTRRRKYRLDRARQWWGEWGWSWCCCGHPRCSHPKWRNPSCCCSHPRWTRHICQYDIKHIKCDRRINPVLKLLVSQLYLFKFNISYNIESKTELCDSTAIIMFVTWINHLIKRKIDINNKRDWGGLLMAVQRKPNIKKSRCGFA